MIFIRFKRAADGVNAVTKASMNGLLRANRYVGATVGNRYSAECMIVHSESAFLVRIWVVPQIFTVCPNVLGQILFFIKD